MGQFTKGQIANPNGRPKGSQNKVTQSFREALSEALTIEDILEDLSKCKSPEKRVELKIRLLEFCIPKLRSVEHREIAPIESLMNLSDHDLEKEIAKLKSEISDGQTFNGANP